MKPDAHAGEKLQRELQRSQQEKEQLDEQVSSAEQRLSELEGKNKDIQQQV